MKLYKLSQTVNNDWDTYDSCVVCARSAKDAITIHPYDDGTPYTKMDIWDTDNWAPQKDIKVECLGTAKARSKRGVILASYNAG